VLDFEDGRFRAWSRLGHVELLTTTQAPCVLLGLKKGGIPPQLDCISREAHRGSILRSFKDRWYKLHLGDDQDEPGQPREAQVTNIRYTSTFQLQEVQADYLSICVY